MKIPHWRLRQRKIIVARMTDPGWVFLMAAAAGLIVERGSLLTHTAIIGRELGIPTIVGAARRLRADQLWHARYPWTGRRDESCRPAKRQRERRSGLYKERTGKPEG